MGFKVQNKVARFYDPQCRANAPCVVHGVDPFHPRKLNPRKLNAWYMPLPSTVIPALRANKF